jgi:hypothetical protein
MSDDNNIVSINYVLNGVSKSICIKDGLPPFNINEVAEDAKVSNTSFGYSGRHDHGLLPQMKSDGPHAVLISALYEAKKNCDKLLTDLIKEEACNEQSPAEKKQRIDEEDVVIEESED